MKKLPFFLTLGLSVAATSAVSAGQPERNSRQTAAEVDDIGSITESDGKDGKSTPAPEAPRTRLSFSARADYTSNALLSGNHAHSDFAFSPNLEAGYRVPFAHGFAFDSLFRLESGVYADNFDRTYIGYSLTNTLEWRPRPNLPRIFVGVEPYRYDRFDGQGRITQAIGTSVGTDWGYGFNNGNSLFFVGYSFTDYFSDPDRDSRNSHAATLGFTQVIRPQLVAQAYYQYVHDSYPNYERQDSRHILGVSVTYQFSKQVFSTLSASFVDNDSTQKSASYQSTGVSWGVNYHF